MLLMGSPIYVHPVESGLSMKEDRWFYDSIMNLPPERSPFSLSGRADSVPLSIHWLTDETLKHKDRYAYHVTRFYTLYLEGHGATLNSFGHDAPTLWQRFTENLAAPAHDYQLSDGAKLELGQIRPPLPAQAHLPPIQERELSQVLPTAAMLKQAEHVEIGISWDCNACDLDLYVQPHRASEALYYSHKESAEGFFHKDYVQSPQTQNGYETVTLTSAIDIDDMLLAVNVYDGTAARITGEIRLAINGETYAAPFTFEGATGNSGAGKDALLNTRAAPNNHWTVIAPKTILGM